MQTRGKTSVYLLGSCEPEILGAKLPSYRQTFGYFMHLLKVGKQTVRYSSQQAIEKTTLFWNRAGIPVRGKKHCIDKLESVFVEWKGLQKHRHRTATAHKIKEEKFIDRL